MKKDACEGRVGALGWRDNLERKVRVAVGGLCASGIKTDHLSHQWVLGTELRSSARAARFLGVSINVSIHVLSTSTHNREHGGFGGC